MRILIDIGNFYYDTDDASVKERFISWKWWHINPLICKLRGHKMVKGDFDAQECSYCPKGHILYA